MTLTTTSAATLSLLLAAILTGCSTGGGSANSGLDGNSAADGTGSNSTTDTDNSEQGEAGTPGVLHDAYLWFDGNVTAVLDGNDVVIEATGRPDHTSPYWNPNNASGLYVAPDPSITTVSAMSPGYIEQYNNLYTLRVPTSPSRSAFMTSTSLGPIGIAVSGAPIFNDQEGPNVDLELGVISGFDRSGGHTGPENYHYHLEPRAISFDDDALIGVIADGFLIYGRKCYSTPGAYPDDLDYSGGHVSLTQHSNGAEEYHYHVKNELYLGSYYLLFPEDFQGTPSTISR
ncbi:MAG: YHYH protein [Pseudomonadota bacterium]